MIGNPILEMTWLGPLTEWDRRIMMDFPHHVVISMENLQHHEEAWQWAEEQFGRDEFTWKSARFFFKCENDATLFRLRWS